MLSISFWESRYGYTTDYDSDYKLEYVGHGRVSTELIPLIRGEIPAAGSTPQHIQVIKWCVSQQVSRYQEQDARIASSLPPHHEFVEEVFESEVVTLWTEPQWDWNVVYICGNRNHRHDLEWQGEPSANGTETHGPIDSIYENSVNVIAVWQIEVIVLWFSGSLDLALVGIVNIVEDPPVNPYLIVLCVRLISVDSEREHCSSILEHDFWELCLP